ncbi:G-protein coupled receptor [Clarias magur]|uniref:G-protein coupled receptor n=1 Tax=Clarias magur TaxID=1594786 RepID=A0A8J4UEK0_CLAMG|nr:G-protein coupled receptor [Clarias magur]
MDLMKPKDLGLVQISAPKSNTNTSTALKSNVIRIETAGQEVKHLSKRLVIVLSMNSMEVIPENQTLSCQFYDVNATHGQEWSDVGSYTNLDNFNSLNTVNCSYDHMTPFAVLLVNMNLTQINSVHWKILSCISYIGCSLSGFFSAVNIFLYIFMNCWITDSFFLYGTNVTFFSFTFLFNLSILVAVTNQIFKLRRLNFRIRKLPSRKDICTVLGLTILLGMTWGFAFFTSGYTNYPVLYLFCICNSLQGKS